MLFSLLGLFNISFFIGLVKNQVFPTKLSIEEENQLISMLDDENSKKYAREKLITHNLRLVAHIANKYESKNENLDDLISIGTIGLVKGIDTYSSSKSTKLATYCAKCIENEILMVLRSNKKCSKNVSLLDSIGVDKEGSEITFFDVIPNQNEDLQASYDKSQKIEKLNEYLKVLDPREMMIIKLRYGLEGSQEYTQKEISKRYNISRSYVSRIEKRALVKLLSEFKKNNN